MSEQPSLFPVQDDRIRVFHNRWDVRSKSEPDAWRTVTLDGECDCMAGCNGMLCWHVKLLRELGYLPENPIPDLEPQLTDIPIPGDHRWIWTARYANKRIAETNLVPVQTSRGVPKFKTGYEIYASLPILAPERGMLGLAYPLFKKAYVRKLEAVGIDKIQEALQEVSRHNVGRPIALLCYEMANDPKNWCHRHMLSVWLSEKLGVEIPELEELS